MPKTQEIPYVENLIEKYREWAYADMFNLVTPKDSEEIFERNFLREKTFETRHKEGLQRIIKRKKITDWDENYSLPSEEFRKIFDANQEEENKIIREAFEQGDCLTYHIISSPDASWDILYERKSAVEKRGERLIFPYSKFPMDSYIYCIFLKWMSNGFNNWKKVYEIEDDLARALISEIKEKDIYMKILEKQAENIKKMENISLAAAKDKVAKRQWMENIISLKFI